MRKVTIEQGPVNTVKFIRQPRPGRKTGKVSVIMFDHEIPEGDVKTLRRKFEDNWKSTVQEFSLEVEVE